MIVGIGEGDTSKLAALVAVPSVFVTAIGPSVAPGGTVAVILFGLSIENAADTPLNVTAVTSGSGPVKLSPLITTGAPIGPLVGVNEEIAGAAARGRVRARDGDREPRQNDGQRGSHRAT